MPGQPDGPAAVAAPRHRRSRSGGRRIVALAVAVGFVAVLPFLADLGRDPDATGGGPQPDAVGVRGTPPPQVVVTTPLPSAPAAGAAPLPAPSLLTAPSASSASSEWTNPDFPPPGRGAATSPLGSPSPPPGGSESYVFTATQDDRATPIAYDPCRQLRYVVRPDHAPPEADALLQDAFTAVERATGLRPTLVGATDEAPALERRPYQPDRYGQAWAPILVAWVTPEEVPEVAGDVLGLAGSVSARAGDLPAVYVSGTVYLDGPQLAELYARPGGRDLVRSTLEHELGHLVGLGHVDDATQLMYPRATGQVRTFQAGDLAGLALLGSGPCVPEL
ncbi:MAG: peptidase [Kineosporiaceae bacterium]